MYDDASHYYAAMRERYARALLDPKMARIILRDPKAMFYAPREYFEVKHRILLENSLLQQVKSQKKRI